MLDKQLKGFGVIFVVFLEEMIIIMKDAQKKKKTLLDEWIYIHFIHNSQNYDR